MFYSLLQSWQPEQERQQSYVLPGRGLSQDSQQSPARSRLQSSQSTSSWVMDQWLEPTRRTLEGKGASEWGTGSQHHPSFDFSLFQTPVTVPMKMGAVALFLCLLAAALWLGLTMTIPESGGGGDPGGGDPGGGNPGGNGCVPTPLPTAEVGLCG